MPEDAPSGSDLRKFIRHPSDIPIQIELESVVSSRTEYLNNISEGGICFKSRVPIDAGALIHIRIPLVHPIFECTGCVVWCEPHEEHYDVGVKFDRGEQIFRLRMVEQICHIEHYKKEALKRGRRLTSEEAALEWIARHAARFPQVDPKTAPPP